MLAVWVECRALEEEQMMLILMMMMKTTFLNLNKLQNDLFTSGYT